MFTIYILMALTENKQPPWQPAFFVCRQMHVGKKAGWHGQQFDVRAIYFIIY